MGSREPDARLRVRGKLRSLLVIVRDHEDLLEADLARFCGIRYTDRWRVDEDGRRRLTLREIWVRIQQLPGDARLVILANDGRPRWTDGEYLLADLYRAWTGSDHPGRPKPRIKSEKSIKRDREIARIKRQFAARNRAIEAGQL